MSAVQEPVSTDRQVVAGTPVSRSVMHYVALLLAVLGMLLLGAACGDGGKNKHYGAAKSQQACLDSCSDARVCAGGFSECDTTCALYELGEWLGGQYRACFRGMSEYYACISWACTEDEDGDPYYDQAAIEECEPILEKYEKVCDNLD